VTGQPEVDFREEQEVIVEDDQGEGNRSETSIPPPYKSKFMLPFKSNFNWEWIH
jgi:hypothetical protein